MATKLVIACQDDGTSIETEQVLTDFDIQEQLARSALDAAMVQNRMQRELELFHAQSHSEAITAFLTPRTDLLTKNVGWPSDSQLQSVQVGTATLEETQAVVAGLLRTIGHLVHVLSARELI